MAEINPQHVKIQGEFWGARLDLNAGAALEHQWQQLEKTGCIQNFRLVADGIPGMRIGFFFADSDAYKWLDAATRVYASRPDPAIKARMDAFIDLIGRTQEADGYIDTYNQFHFPGTRWQNLQIEHELYCHGHLIEAAVSHYQATGETRLLEIGRKAADLLVRDFTQAGPEGTPGHQEIEIALLRLYRVTGEASYLDLAAHFLEQRGRMRPFLTHILQSNRSFTARAAQVTASQAAHQAAHPEHAQQYHLPGDNVSPKPPWGQLRWFLNMASGKYFQQHQPVRHQTVPVGHAVRFAYMQTAMVMLYRERGDSSLLAASEQAWEHMVARRMYLTGGTGSLPNIEGFGRDYELDPFYSYSETCAALGDIFWNWELTLATGQAQYADLTEWQLYNAAAVGLGQEGTSYLYNNPLAARGGVTRQAWFKCPCCPSNISRTWADLGKYLFSAGEGNLWVHQYVSANLEASAGLPGVGLQIESRLPWEGLVTLHLQLETPLTFSLHLRIPSWSEETRLAVNGESIPVKPPPTEHTRQTGGGYDPTSAWYLPLQRTWQPGDRVSLQFETGIRLRRNHPQVRATRGQTAVTRGPLVYCLESHDNPGLDLFALRLDPASLRADADASHFGGAILLRGRTQTGQPRTFIPYFLWANRGESEMTVYLKI
jgi:uncharacterized protein